MANLSQQFKGQTIEIKYVCNSFRPDADNWCTTGCNITKCPYHKYTGERMRRLYAELDRLEKMRS